MLNPMSQERTFVLAADHDVALKGAFELILLLQPMHRNTPCWVAGVVPSFVQTCCCPELIMGNVTLEVDASL